MWYVMDVVNRDDQLPFLYIVTKLGVIHSTQAAIELMSLENGHKGGIIANISSIAGYEIFLGTPTYTATKHAIIGYTRTLAVCIIWNLLVISR